VLPPFTAPNGDVPAPLFCASASGIKSNLGGVAAHLAGFTVPYSGCFAGRAPFPYSARLGLERREPLPGRALTAAPTPAGQFRPVFFCYQPVATPPPCKATSIPSLGHVFR